MKRSFCLSAAVLGMVGLALIMPAAMPAGLSPTAQASPQSAMTRCQSGQPSDANFAIQYWDGGIAVPTFTLQPGDVYRVHVSGMIKTGYWPWDPAVGGDGLGWSNPAPRNVSPSYLQPGLPRYGLVAGWAGLPGWFWLGANSLCIQWTGITPGTAILQMNDNFFSDNSGSWVISVNQFRA
jgi:hypothetical protein